MTPNVTRANVLGAGAALALSAIVPRATRPMRPCTLGDKSVPNPGNETLNVRARDCAA